MSENKDNKLTLINEKTANDYLTHTWEENKLTFALFRVKVLLNRGGRASSFIYLLYRELQEVGVQHDRDEANGLLRAS